MHKSFVCPKFNQARVVAPSLAGLALLIAGMPADAAEGYRLRQSPVGVFGGEMAASVDNPGFFGTAALTDSQINRITDNSGQDLALPARSVPIPTGAATGGAVPNGTYKVQVPPGTIDFKQTQTQLNLVGGYATQDEYGGGRFVTAINVPLIKQSRTVTAEQPLGTVSPTLSAPVPGPLQRVIAGGANAVNLQVQAGVAAATAGQNADVSGLGDTEVSFVWVREKDRLRVVPGVSVFLPTGEYDKDRGPNPGFGKFYTVRAGVAVSYALNPNALAKTWDSGVTVAGRISYGVNSRNMATGYRSGDFVYLEAGVAKVIGDWAIGANALAIRQVTDDSGPNAIGRYRNYSAGPFLAYKIPGKDAGFNLHYSQNFGGRNALQAESLQLRFIKAW